GRRRGRRGRAHILPRMTSTPDPLAPDAPDYDDLAALLGRIGYTEPPAHFHGALCGALCTALAEQLGASSLLDGHAADAEALDAVSRLRDESCAALLSTDMSFEPLLPVDAYPLAQRVDALAAW